ncbi:hypothetical protein CPB85DRAFT_1256018 [Mucidula mucida]|nr:hypothetical protein CPB85DRAFT_1256018 [Mucidula mucida]
MASQALLSLSLKRSTAPGSHSCRKDRYFGTTQLDSVHSFGLSLIMTFNFKQRDYRDKLFIYRLTGQARAHSMRSVNSLVTVGDCGQLGVKSSALCIGDGLLAVQLFPAGKEVRDCMAVWVGDSVSPLKSIQEHIAVITSPRVHRSTRGGMWVTRGSEWVHTLDERDTSLDKENVRQECGVIHEPFSMLLSVISGAYLQVANSHRHRMQAAKDLVNKHMYRLGYKWKIGTPPGVFTEDICTQFMSRHYNLSACPAGVALQTESSTFYNRTQSHKEQGICLLRLLNILMSVLLESEPLRYMHKVEASLRAEEERHRGDVVPEVFDLTSFFIMRQHHLRRAGAAATNTKKVSTGRKALLGYTHRTFCNTQNRGSANVPKFW